MKKYFGYIRVSTHKQGEKGSSLIEQKSAIERYAQKHNLTITGWYEEQETAAKLGRKLFRQMLNQIKAGKASGVILHKIDRGARNLKDWAELAGLMDAGVDVHFAHESLDLTTRGGRLSADIQAVVAADFIRNLRDEVKKGLYGRLNQGFYPWRAPLGYKDNGSAEFKTIDQVKGPLVVKAFELYATGEYTLRSIAPVLAELGLKNSNGKPFGKTALALVFRNPFYIGRIQVKGQSFLGGHQPLISTALFDHVQKLKAGRWTANTSKESTNSGYLLQRLLLCNNCNCRLYPERQKGHSYFRCHTKTCAGTSLREDTVKEMVMAQLSTLPDSPSFAFVIREFYSNYEKIKASNIKGDTNNLKLQLANLEARLSKLTDTLLNGLLDESEFVSRKALLIDEKLKLNNQLKQVAEQKEEEKSKLNNFLELTKRLKNIAELPDVSSARQILKMAVSNIHIQQKTIDIKWSKPIQALLLFGDVPAGAPNQDEVRVSKSRGQNLSNEQEACLKTLMNEISNFEGFDESVF